MTPALTEALASITTTLAAIGWFVGLRPNADDADTSAAHEFVLNALSDADAIRTLDCISDGDLRSQITIEQAIELHQEAELRRYERRN